MQGRGVQGGPVICQLGRDRPDCDSVMTSKVEQMAEGSKVGPLEPKGDSIYQDSGPRTPRKCRTDRASLRCPVKLGSQAEASRFARTEDHGGCQKEHLHACPRVFAPWQERVE